jgi:hypothetical protein
MQMLILIFGVSIWLSNRKPRKIENRQRDSLNLVYLSQLNTIFHTIEGVDENLRKEEYLPLMMVA